MNKYLPSKKFSIFIGSVVLVGVVIWGGAMLLSKKTKYVKSNDIAATDPEIADNFYLQDSDKDGIYDWEEGLWGTSPSKKDTDGDGVSDGDDIKARKKIIQERNSLSGEVEISGDLNQTEIFARQLFSAASLANQGGGLSAESLDDLSKTFDQSITGATIADLYQAADLKLAEVSLAGYKNDLQKIFKPYVESGISIESAIYRLSAGDASAAADLEKAAEYQHDISNALITLRVPHAVAGQHLAMANTSGKIALALLSLKDIEDDPILAMVGLRQYLEYSDGFEKAASSLGAYFRANGIL